MLCVHTFFKENILILYSVKSFYILVSVFFSFCLEGTNLYRILDSVNYAVYWPFLKKMKI